MHGTYLGDFSGFPELVGALCSIVYTVLTLEKNIGITHVFSCINICRVPMKLGRVFKHRPRDPASVNAMKQTCVIVILAYFT